MLQGFRDFVARPNLVELAVAFVMGAATVTLVQALVADLITPIIAAIIGKPSFGDLKFTVNGSEFLYGDFLNALISFLSVAAAVYVFVVLPYTKIQERRGITPGTKACPECTSQIPVAARRCPMCTGQLAPTPPMVPVGK